MSSPEETWYPSEGPSLMSTSSAKQRSPQNQERDFSSDDDDEHAPGVIETGKEHTGRWTRAEHQAFLFALQQYGKEWKKVAAHVKTRTVVQTRTHAQKYFQKLQKGLTNAQGQVRMEASIEAQKMLPIAAQKRSSSAKKKSSTRNSLLLTPAISSNLKQETEATQAAAHLMSQMARSSTPGDTNQIARAIDPYANPQVSYATPFHSGFSGRADNTSFSYATPQMKITIPRPDFASERNMFPEPSPAACGKRKVLELETANTLLGVVSSGGASFSSLSKDISRKATPPPTNASNFGESGDTGMIELRKDFSSAKSAAPGGEGLHIVNPDNFPHERTTLRQGLGYEPTTPWDIELEALSSEVKDKRSDGTDSPLKTENSLEISQKDPSTEIPLDNPERSDLHTAICNGHVEKVNEIVQHLSSLPDNSSTLTQVINAADMNGFTPLHSAVTLDQGERQEKISTTMTKVLISAGAVVGCIDKFGNSALHWAARAGSVDTVKLLLLEGCSVDLRNDKGETPLHWAMRSGVLGMGVTRFLLENGARSLFNKAFKRPFDVAAAGFDEFGDNLHPVQHDFKHEKDIDLVQQRRDSRKNFFMHCPQARSLVLHHPECLEHVPKYETDWECPGRVESIMNPLLNKQIDFIQEHEIQVTSEFDKASLEFLSRVHSAEYLTFVNKLSKELEQRNQNATNENPSSAPSIVPFTPMVQRSVLREAHIKKGTHSDTSFSSGSLRAARRAAGAVKHAIDCVLVGRNRNAFCVVRPPGHHAGVNGLLDGGESCGFCIFNNVAAGAMYALSDEIHGPKCERVAIIDIDVHHGNGTEAIVRKCDEPGRLFFFSVHLYDNEKKKSNPFKFYPGTGDEDDVAHNVINVPIAPMWKDKTCKPKPSPANSLTDRQHNTRHKSRLHTNKVTEKNISNDERNVSENDLSPSVSSQDIESQTNSEISEAYSKHSSPSFLYGFGRDAYRKAIQQRLLPALRAFNPDLILISTGLDAAKDDVGNARHFRNGKQFQGINLTPEDYAWTTSKILEVADICCQGRIVSILEGGYGKSPNFNLENIASSQGTPNQLDKSTFSECALHHLRALIDPHNVEMRYPHSQSS